MNWLYLMAAIGFEIVATSALKATDGFTRVAPTVLTVTCYVAAFFCLSVALRTIPMGVAYAIWSGIGNARRARARRDRVDPGRHARHQPVFRSGAALIRARSNRAASGQAVAMARMQATSPSGPIGW
jgi:hypothetical protein